MRLWLLLAAALLAGCGTLLRDNPAVELPPGDPLLQRGDAEAATMPRHSPRAIPRRALVGFEPQVSAAERAAAIARVGGRTIESLEGLDVALIEVPDVVAAIRALERHPGVEYAEADAIAYAAVEPDDTLYAKQWGPAKIGAPQAWEVTSGAPTIRIAVVDTGIDRRHPDVGDRVVASVSFVAGTTDDHGHGTHVAGIAAATANNARGVAGLDWQARLLAVKVLDRTGVGPYSAVAKGIRWAADHGARVINLSLVGESPSRTLRRAVEYAWGRGAVLSCAAGNSGTSARMYPAAYDRCLAVAATNSRDRRASFSTFGAWVDVAAPGVRILSTVPAAGAACCSASSGYAELSGTSMATPHTSGLAALLWARGLASNGAVRDRIERTADRISGTGSYWVHGRINAARAVR